MRAKRSVCSIKFYSFLLSILVTNDTINERNAVVRGNECETLTVSNHDVF